MKPEGKKYHDELRRTFFGQLNKRLNLDKFSAFVQNTLHRRKISQQQFRLQKLHHIKREKRENFIKAKSN